MAKGDARDRYRKALAEGKHPDGTPLKKPK